MTAQSTGSRYFYNESKKITRLSVLDECSEACASICAILHMPLTEIRLSLLLCFEESPP